MSPLKLVQDNTIRGSFGDDPELRAQIDEWFRLVFQTAQKQSPPITIKAEELQQVNVPTLSALGTKDNLMGDLGKVRELASNVPGIEIVEIEASHLIGMEEPETRNQLIPDFLGRPHNIPNASAYRNQAGHSTSVFAGSGVPNLELLLTRTVNPAFCWT